jgi:Recombination endonuclease VII
MKTMGLFDMTRGERISAVKRGLVPPVRSERERQLRSRYGLLLEDYDALLVQGDGACWSCEKRFDYDLYVDHDHETGKVRGLLCARCNTLVGMLEDESIWQAWTYLNNSRREMFAPCE